VKFRLYYVTQFEPITAAHFDKPYNNIIIYIQYYYIYIHCLYHNSSHCMCAAVRVDFKQRVVDRRYHRDSGVKNADCS